MKRGLAGIIAIAAAVLTVAAPRADAASSVCRALEAKLAAASTGSRDTAESQKWRNAARKQRSEIAKAQSRCGGGFLLFGGGREPGCNDTIRRMQRNLDQLERRADQLSGRSGPGRSTILAALEQNGCRGGTRELLVQKRNQNRDIISQIFGGGLPRGSLDEDANRKTIRATLNPNNPNSVTISGVGTYRTLCVRTCDGYFFPISFSTRKEMFDRDQVACEAACPGTEVKLYVHEIPEQETEDMVSVSGEPYAKLATAWNFQQVGYKRAPTCACGAPKGYTVVAGDKTVKAPPPSEIPLPNPRPDPDAVAEEPPPPAERDYAAADRKVRVVGPTFLPDPEEALDLRAPAQKAVQ